MGNPSEKDVEKANPDQAGWPLANGSTLKGQCHENFNLQFFRIFHLVSEFKKWTNNILQVLHSDKDFFRNVLPTWHYPFKDTV